MHSIWHGIKRSWHSIEGDFEIVGVERMSVTKQISSMHRVNGEDEREWMVHY